MAKQFSVTVRNARADTIETTIGTSPRLRLFTGAPPVNTAAAATGTLLADIAVPADWLANAAAGSKAISGTWTGTASANGTAGYYRLLDTSAATVHEQGTIAQSASLATNAPTAANGNVLNFAATTGVTVGANVAGTGIPADTQVAAVTSTTVTLTRTATAGVANAATITFTGDLTLDNPVLAATQNVTINAWSYVEGNA